MTKKKKRILIGAGAAAVLAVFAAIWFFFLREAGDSTAASEAYTTSVAQLTGNLSGTVNRFAGIVEPQQTIKIQKASDRKVKEVFVKEGDTVSKGTPLFSYDTDETQMKLSEAELERERIANEISTLYEQIETLRNEKEKAPESEVFSYTTQILTAQNDVKRAEYSQKSKTIEVEQIRKSLENATVNSEINGVVKSINDGSHANIYNSGDDSSYMTILSNKEYRIKGTLNEQNMSAITMGQPILIHSRIDGTLVWNGTVTEIDTENPVNQNNNGYMIGSSDTQTTSSSYNFYVEIEEGAPLMLGQHVFMEPDMGQTEEKEGLWLSSFYLIIDGNDTYIWAAGKNDRLEKRKVTTGEYDEAIDEYEITSGLTEEDYIAFPEDSLSEGMTCIKNAPAGDGIMSDTSGGKVGVEEVIQ